MTANLINWKDTPESKWDTAVVVDVNDPQKALRVKIRVEKLHDGIDDQFLPWASTISSSPMFGRIGHGSVPYVKGSQVHVVWKDQYKQFPIIIGAWSKTGDPIPGKFENGAPALDTNFAGHPASTNGVPNNPYSQLNTNRITIGQIDQGISNVFSVAANVGIQITKEIEKVMDWAKWPTIASIPPGSNMDVLAMARQVDPKALSSALPCFPINFFSLQNLLSLASQLANSFKQMMVNAIKNAFLKLMQSLGIGKVLGVLNQVAQTISEVKNLLNQLAIRTCSPNILNQGLFGAVNGALSQALSTVNSLAGFVTGTVSSIGNAVVGTASGIFDSIVSYPLASIATASSARPNQDQILQTPPNGYVPTYQADDPYPGYKIWTDPQGNGQPIYTPRNGEPNFTTAQQAATYAMDQMIVSRLENALTSGNLNASTLSGILNDGMNVLKQTAISSVVGYGFSLVNSALGAVLQGTLTAENFNLNFSAQIEKTYIVTQNATNAMSNFAINRSTAAMQELLMRSAV